MKFPHFEIKTPSNRTLASFNFLRGLGAIIILLSVIAFLIEWHKTDIFPSNYFDLPIDDTGSIPSLFVKLLRKIVAIFLSIGAALLIYNVLLKILIYIFQTAELENIGSRLYNYKVLIDLKRSALLSEGTIREETNYAIKLSKIYIKAIKDKNHLWVDNKSFYSIDKRHFKNNISREITTDFPNTLKKCKVSYQDLIEKIEALVSSINEPIETQLEFKIALVQPAFSYILKKVLNESKANKICAINTNSLTGPQTIRSSVEFKSNVSNQKKLIAFIAPLSTFVTAQIHNDNGEELDPRNYFVPVITLTSEDQELYFVEGSSSVPNGKRKLFFYNNSTAEECIAIINKSLNERFIPSRINDYEHYKLLLNGSSIIDEGVKMESGDGIVLWTPLTEYFKDRDIKNKYFSNFSSQENYNYISNRSESKIILFAEKELSIYSSEIQKLYKLVLHAMVLKIAIIKRELEDKKMMSLWRTFQIKFNSYKFSESERSEFLRLFKPR